MPPAVRAAIDPSFTPRGHRDRLLKSIQEKNTLLGPNVESVNVKLGVTKVTTRI